MIRVSRRLRSAGGRAVLGRVRCSPGAYALKREKGGGPPGSVAAHRHTIWTRDLDLVAAPISARRPAPGLLLIWETGDSVLAMRLFRNSDWNPALELRPREQGPACRLLRGWLQAQEWPRSRHDGAAPPLVNMPYLAPPLLRPPPTPTALPRPSTAISPDGWWSRPVLKPSPRPSAVQWRHGDLDQHAAAENDPATAKRERVPSSSDYPTGVLDEFNDPEDSSVKQYLRASTSVAVSRCLFTSFDRRVSGAAAPYSRSLTDKRCGEAVTTPAGPPGQTEFRCWWTNFSLTHSEVET
jgi:hypothetical protein